MNDDEWEDDVAGFREASQKAVSLHWGNRWSVGRCHVEMRSARYSSQEVSLHL